MSHYGTQAGAAAEKWAREVRASRQEVEEVIGTIHRQDTLWRCRGLKRVRIVKKESTEEEREVKLRCVVVSGQTFVRSVGVQRFPDCRLITPRLCLFSFVDLSRTWTCTLLSLSSSITVSRH